jgi:putative membrane protein
VKQTNIARAFGAVIAAAGLAAAPFAVSAQSPPPGTPPMGGMGSPRMPSNDADFVRALDATNTAELEMAKYLVNRTQDPAIHQFAQHMIDDHSTAAVKLEAATRGTNLIPVPREMAADRAGMRALALLEGEDGTQRDNDYMRIQVPAHRHALALLNWESENGTNAGLKTLATNLAPTVQQHLQLAQVYLAAHNLTPYAPSPPNPVPGSVNPNGTQRTGTPNNPASTTNGGSTSGRNNGTAPSPMPMTSASPHP